MNNGDTVYEVERTDWWCNIAKRNVPDARVQDWLVVSQCPDGSLIVHGIIYCSGAHPVTTKKPRDVLYTTRAAAERAVIEIEKGEQRL